MLFPRVVAWSAAAAKRGFLVVGHRGNGMNLLGEADRRQIVVKENTIRSFNRAALSPIDFVEFDVQVTKDDIPIIFHDDILLTEVEGKIVEKHVPHLYLEEFLSYGPQRDTSKMGKKLLRQTKDGRVLNWDVEEDDPLCTLQEAFENVHPRMGFDIELKFIDHQTYQESELTHALETVLKVVLNHANNRSVIFSTFQPDAALLMKKLQNAYPVFFLTHGGMKIFTDERRNSVDEAIKLCLEGGLQGIVSDVVGFLQDPSALSKMHEHNLSLLTFGRLNNIPEAVYLQYLMGVDGVVVDLVEEIARVVSGSYLDYCSVEFNEDNPRTLSVAETTPAAI